MGWNLLGFFPLILFVANFYFVLGEVNAAEYHITVRDLAAPQTDQNSRVRFVFLGKIADSLEMSGKNEGIKYNKVSVYTPPPPAVS